MKLLITILFFIISTVTHAGEVELGYFAKEDLVDGQHGCRYYYPVNKKQSGNIIGLGDSAKGHIFNDKWKERNDRKLES